MKIQAAYLKYNDMIRDNTERFRLYFKKELKDYMNRVAGFRPKKFSRDCYLRYISDEDLIINVLEKYGKEAADLLQVLMERK